MQKKTKKSPSCTLGIESNHTLMVEKNPLAISIPNAAHMHYSEVPFFFKDTSLRVRDQLFVD